ncbi:MAG: hypothetical protein ABSE99_17720 [Terracidiphilus sp.]|jgi:hypothetical protein
MYKPIPVEEVIAAFPADAQKTIAARGKELLADVDAHFRIKVQEALDDPRPGIPHEQVEAHFAKRRAASLRKAQGTGS